MDNGQAVHVADVQVERSGYLARVLWEPMHGGASEDAVRAALERKKGILRHHVNSYINQRIAVQLEFVPRSAVVPVAPAGSSSVGDALAAVRADLDATQQRRDERDEARSASHERGLEATNEADAAAAESEGPYRGDRGAAS